MIKKLLYIVVITIIIFLLVGFILPREVHVERSLEIRRPAAEVFGLLNSYESFSAWSPWVERDPDALYEFSGPESGVGAHLSWSGDPRLVGAGWQEIIESRPDSLIRTRLDFEQQGVAESYFELLDTAAGVEVTWGFDTDLTLGQGVLGGLLARYFGLFFDQWIGSDYEQGLDRLKVYAEGLPQANTIPVDIEVLDVAALDILYIPNDASQDAAAIADALASAYREISTFMAENDIEMNGQPMAITRAWDEQGYQFDAAIPVRMKPVELSGRVLAGQSPSGPSVRVVHRGPYDRMAPSYQKLAAYMDAHQLLEGSVSWEHYISDPGETVEDELVTHIYFQIGN
jgi:effector-binding domain-containing protein